MGYIAEESFQAFFFFNYMKYKYAGGGEKRIHYGRQHYKILVFFITTVLFN